MLTGETKPVHKICDVINVKDAINQQKLNMLFSGTLVKSGNGIAVVCSIGMKTEMGKIQKNV